MPDYPRFLGLHARPGQKLNWLLVVAYITLYAMQLGGNAVQAN